MVAGNDDILPALSDEETPSGDRRSPGVVEKEMESHESTSKLNDNKEEETQIQAGGSNSGETEENEGRISAEVKAKASNEGEEVAGENQESEAKTPVEEPGEPEKLADDVIELPRWRQILYRLFPKLQKSE